MIYMNEYPSPLGAMIMTSDEEGLTGLWFAEGSRYGHPEGMQDALRCENTYFDQTKRWLDIYFTGHDPVFLPRIHRIGSAFRNRVSEILCKIPFGHTVTYGWIAKQIAVERGLKTMSAQAVGGAVGHNPIDIIVPCHRVVGASGSLTGYGGGILRKKALLELEGVDIRRFTIPQKGTALS